jgi:hypothetical protein
MERSRNQREAWLAPGSAIEESTTFGTLASISSTTMKGCPGFCYVAGAKVDNNRVKPVYYCPEFCSSQNPGHQTLTQIAYRGID